MNRTATLLAAGLAWALAAAGCSRDLNIPSVDPLAVDPAATSRAPRQRLSLVASGGAGSYRFRFAAGGQVSGEDATIDAATGLYVAGSRGSAQDVVEVVDAAGTVATARIGVGPRLSLSPALAGTAPGGHLLFVASGGQPPYQFVLLPEPGSDSTLVGSADTSRSYAAGALAGDAVEHVVVTDATGDPAARAEAEVRVGRALSLFRASAGSLAPGETADLVALGGQPPYAYRIATDGSRGASIDAAGRYRAGPTGPAQDVVEATDANLATTTMPIPIGPRLALTSFTAPELRPSVPVDLVPTGGKAPYAFSFAPRGNRSRGTLGSLSGQYVPGPIPSAVDRLEVTDATGAAVEFDAPPVGAFPIEVGTGVIRCSGGDLDYDGRADVVLSTYGTRAQATHVTWSLPANGLPVQRTYWTNGGADWMVVTDLDRDGRADLLSSGGPGGAPWTWHAAPDGSFADGAVFPLAGVGEAPERLAVVWGYGNGDRDIFTSAYVNTGGLPLAHSWTWTPGATVPSPDLLQPLALWPEGYASVYRFTAGHFVDYLQPTLASVPGTISGAPFDHLRLQTRTATGWDAPIDLPLPAGYVVAGRAATPYAEADFVKVERFNGYDDLALLLTGPDGRSRVSVFHGGAFSAPVDPDPSGPPAAGLAVLDLGDRLVIATWNELDGRLAGLQVLQDGTVELIPVLSRPRSFPITCATFLDVNGDGALDLVAAGASSALADVLPGEGRGVAGHPLFEEEGDLAVRDLDGDGLDDVVSATAALTLRVEPGSGHQLAAGAETPVGRAISTPVALGPAVAWIDPTDGRLLEVPVGVDGRPGNLQTVPLVPLDGAPASLAGVPTNRIYAADLGGGAAGDDLWYVYDTGAGDGLGLLLRQLDGTALQLRPPVAAAEACRYAPAADPGGPITAFVAACPSATGTTVLRAAWTPGPGAPGLGPWGLVEEHPNTWVRRLNAVGTGGFMLEDWFTHEASIAFATPSGPLRLEPLPVVPSSGDLVLADLDGDGWLDALVPITGPFTAMVSSWAVLYGGPGGFTRATPDLAIFGAIVAAPRLAPGGQRDLLVRFGNSVVALPAPPHP